jgi:hypothetical protein
LGKKGVYKKLESSKILAPANNRNLGNLEKARIENQRSKKKKSRRGKLTKR